MVFPDRRNSMGRNMKALNSRVCTWSCKQFDIVEVRW